jgi:hypothetical protein
MTSRFDPKTVTIKPGEFYNLQMSLDYDEDPEDKHPVLLFTPDMNDKGHHFHIALKREEAERLFAWLSDHGVVR